MERFVITQSEAKHDVSTFCLLSSQTVVSLVLQHWVFESEAECDGLPRELAALIFHFGKPIFHSEFTSHAGSISGKVSVSDHGSCLGSCHWRNPGGSGKMITQPLPHESDVWEYPLNIWCFVICKEASKSSSSVHFGLAKGDCALGTYDVSDSPGQKLMFSCGELRKKMNDAQHYTDDSLSLAASSSSLLSAFETPLVQTDFYLRYRLVKNDSDSEVSSVSVFSKQGILLESKPLWKDMNGLSQHSTKIHEAGDIEIKGDRWYICAYATGFRSKIKFKFLPDQTPNFKRPYWAW